MGAKAKHDIAPLVRTAFVNALGLIEKDTGKTLPEMMRECIEDHGLLAVLDKLSKYTVREKHTTHESTRDFEQISSFKLEEWLGSFQSGGSEDTAQDKSVPFLQGPDKPGIQ